MAAWHQGRCRLSHSPAAVVGPWEEAAAGCYHRLTRNPAAAGGCLEAEPGGRCHRQIHSPAAAAGCLGAVPGGRRHRQFHSPAAAGGPQGAVPGERTARRRCCRTARSHRPARRCTALLEGSAPGCSRQAGAGPHSQPDGRHGGPGVLGALPVPVPWPQRLHTAAHAPPPTAAAAPQGHRPCCHPCCHPCCRPADPGEDHNPGRQGGNGGRAWGCAPASRAPQALGQP